MRQFLLLPFILLAVLLASCTSIVPYYKADIQQGNVLPAAKIAKLKPGMTRIEITNLLGDAVLQNSLDSQQLQYIYTDKPNQGKYVEKRLLLQLRNGKLVSAKGDYPAIPASLKK
jgi:outer membrane protein assembly factor BamE